MNDDEAHRLAPEECSRYPKDGETPFPSGRNCNRSKNNRSDVTKADGKAEVECSHGVASTPPRSEMTLLPRRCPRLLLIQIPTWTALGPFCVLLRSSQPVVFRSYHTTAVSRASLYLSENGRHIVSFLLSRANLLRADCLFPAFGFAVFFPLAPRGRGFPRGSSSLSFSPSPPLPRDNDRSWNTMDTMEGEVSRRCTIDDRWQRSKPVAAASSE